MSTIASTSCSTGRISRRRALALLVAAVIAAACTATAPIAAAPSAGRSASGVAALVSLPPNAFQILHTSDIHGHLEATTAGRTVEQGGMALLGGMIRLQRSRAPARTLTLDAGDALSGTLIAAMDHGASMTRAMSLIGYDAQAIGNHDLDWGQEELAKRAAEASFPFLAANVVESATGRPPAWATPYIVKDLGIARVGIIGLTYPSAAIIKATSTKGLVFLPGIDSVRRYLPEVRRQADVVVVLSHLGIDGGTSRIAEGDTALAGAVPGIDLIIGGHDHITLTTPRTVGRTTTFEAGSYGRELGRVEVTVDPATRRVVPGRTSNAVLAAATGAAAPLASVAALAAQRRADADAYGKRIVGRATATFSADRDMNNALGEMVADALLDYGRREGWSSDLAFYNAAGIRASIPRGDVTYERLAEVLPFQDTVVSVDLTGTQLKEVFEGMAGAAGRLFVSGATLAYRSSGRVGDRVARATIAGQPLDPGHVYHVATVDYLQGGGDGHTVFTQGSNVIYGDVDLDVVAAYVAARSPISPVSEGRVSTE